MTIIDTTTNAIEVVNNYLEGAKDIVESVDRVETYLAEHYELTNGGEFFTVGKKCKDGYYLVYEDDITTDSRVVRFKVLLED